MLSSMLSKAKYRYQDRSKKAIKDVIDCYKNLAPHLEKVQITKSNERNLVVLKGTIPICYRSNYYHYPVSLAIPHDYPNNPPICHVRPTPDMIIKPSENVDLEGRVFLPYLANWDENSSDLLGVIQVMIIIFQEKPPLYAKPKNPPAVSASEPQQQPATPYPPYPVANRFPGSNPPPYPSYPLTGSNQQAQAAPPVYPATSTSSPSYPPYPSASQPQKQQQAGSWDTNTMSEHVRMSYMSAAEDRLKNRAKDIQQQYLAEINVLKRTNEDLVKGRKTLENIVKNIETNLVEVDKCKDKMNTKIVRLNEFITKSEESKGQTNIDEYFGPVQPLYKQLFNAFVEENAIVDAIYYLNEALNKEVIDLDVFLKHVRELSRRQFINRALVKCCREKAGLPS